MANAWFRMYSEFATDPKVQMMSEANQRRFLMVLCLRCSNDDVTLQDEEVAFQLRISNDEWQQTKQELMARNLVSEDNRPTAWDKRQFISDSSAARVAKHREQKRGQVKRACNVTVTPPDTDTDTETDKKKQGTKPAARFRPPSIEDIRAYCEERENTVNPETFLDFYTANGWVQGKGKPIKDWRAAVRTWEKGERNGSAQPGTPLEIPEGNDMPARSELWRLCQEASITADEVRGKSPDAIRELIRARHPRATQRPKLRAIDGGRAA